MKRKDILVLSKHPKIICKIHYNVSQTSFERNLYKAEDSRVFKHWNGDIESNRTEDSWVFQTILLNLP